MISAVRDLKKDAAAMGAAGSASSIMFVELDLSSLESVNARSAACSAEGDPFDLVIANAGVMAVPFALIADGVEAHFAANYLGHYLLVNRMAALLNPHRRVVMVSSAGHRGADVDLAWPTPVHLVSTRRRAAIAAMSQVATAGIFLSPLNGRKNTPFARIGPACRAILSMKDGFGTARNATPVLARRSSIRNEEVASPPLSAQGVPRPSVVISTTYFTP